MFNSVMRAFAWLVGIAALLIAAGALPSSHPLPILMCLMMVVPATAIHEAGHAFAARRNGMRVIEIHVWLLNILPLRRGLDRPAFRRHPVAIIDGNDRGVYGQQQAVHG